MRSAIVLIFAAIISLNAFSIDEKVLKSSLDERRINDVKMDVLRVRKGKIESSAKDLIILVQKELDNCHKNLKKGRDISTDLNDLTETIRVVGEKDSDWPVKYYTSELDILKRLNTASFPPVKNESQIQKATSQSIGRLDNGNRNISTDKAGTQHERPKSNSNATGVNYKTQKIYPSVSPNAQKISYPTNDNSETTKSSNHNGSSSSNDFFLWILLIVGVIAGIIWIMANMHLFFGGVLVILSFLLYRCFTEIDYNEISPVWLCCGIVVDIFLWIICYNYSIRCTSCKKWGAMQEINRELVDERASSMKKTSTVKDKRGNAIFTYDNYVHATTYTYHIHRRCKYCQHEDYLVKKTKKEN